MTDVRSTLAAAIRGRVSGPEGATRAAELLDAPGPRWFGPDRPVRVVHADASMFVGGLRALLLQTLHPLAMAGVAQHSDYRHDPWGRLQRTADFLAATTFGPADQADAVVDRVRRVHHHVRGIAPDGRPYAASDPRLMRWVHLAEVDSFLRAHDRFGRTPLSPDERDGYVTDMAVVARALGIPAPPTSVQGLRDQLATYRGELHGTAQARDAARYLLVRPPMPLAARPAYAVLAASAIALLPRWARRELHLPYTPVADAAVVRPAGDALVRAMRWVLAPGAYDDQVDVDDRSRARSTKVS